MGLVPATSLPLGFRFQPTDEELVLYYLKRKVHGKPFCLDAICEIDIYKSEPWDLPGKSRLKTGDLEWYFFSAVYKKCGNGSTTNRATEKGYWKPTGKDRPVNHKSRTVGMKKTLVFHSGGAPRGEMTNWVMHEYRLVDEELEKSGLSQKDALVLCRIFQNSGSGPKNEEHYGSPFIEEEWKDDQMVMISGEDVPEEVEIADCAYLNGNDLDQVSHSFYGPEDGSLLPCDEVLADWESFEVKEIGVQILYEGQKYTKSAWNEEKQVNRQSCFLEEIDTSENELEDCYHFRSSAVYQHDNSINLEGPAEKKGDMTRQMREYCPALCISHYPTREEKGSMDSSSLLEERDILHESANKAQSLGVEESEDLMNKKSLPEDECDPASMDLQLSHKVMDLYRQGQALLPKVVGFLLKVKDEDKHIFDDEFLEEIRHMPMIWPISILQVLDLSYTCINSLPHCISGLTSLQKFTLKSCDLLMELPPEIGELVNLEVLDLEGTKLIYLPKEIANLINLTCLKVAICGHAHEFLESKHMDMIIPRGAFSKLSRMEELSIDVLPEGDWWDAEIKATVTDLSNLRDLRILKLYLPSIELLEDLKWDVSSLIYPYLANFRLIIGRHEERFISRVPEEVKKEFDNLKKLEKGLNYINGEGIPIEITKALTYANALFLDRHRTLKSLSEFGTENMDELKFCCLVDCNLLETVIDASQFHQENELSSLQYLRVYYMKKMESICKGPVGKGCLLNLKSLSLHTCPNLTTVFTAEMLGNFRSLEELLVEDCEKISSLVCLESPNSKLDNFLPNLKKLSLLELPELVNISNGICIAPNLERMVIYYCPMLEKLSITEVSSQNLTVLKGDIEWWDIKVA